MNTIELAYQRFCRKRFPLPTEAQVRALEERIHVELPEDYRNFLLQFNGGYFDNPEFMLGDAEDSGEILDCLNGIGASHESAELASPLDLSLFSDNDPPQVLPIGSTPTGDLILLDTAPGEERGMVYFKKAFGGSSYVADGIEEFIAQWREFQPDE